MTRWLLASVLLFVSAPAFADEKDTCSAAHVEGQTARRDGKLLHARQRFQECANERCPDLVNKDCTKWAAELGSSIPSIVVEARDEDGRETASVALSIDGKRRVDRLDGRAIELDPGDHVIRIELANGRATETHVMVREGERVRRVTVAFPPRVKPTREKLPPATSGSSSALPFVFGGIAVVAFGSFGTFALLGKQKQNELNECRPDCAQSDVDSMRMRYAIGDISLVVGAVATGLTVYFALSGPGPKGERAFIAPRVSQSGPGLAGGATF